jgi:phosphatidylserine/phosphatidylglycerophosphate/cardiolipin synthase-like enzyme
VNSNWDETQVLRQIYNARQSVELQFMIYNPAGNDNKYYGVLDSALINASRRGIKVKLLVSDRGLAEKPVEYLKKLSSYPNIEIKYSSFPGWSGVVSDSSSCWIGSCNAEKSSFYNNRNVGVVINNRGIATRMYDIFMKDWNSSYTHPITPEGKYSAGEIGEKNR